MHFSWLSGLGVLNQPLVMLMSSPLLCLNTTMGTSNDWNEISGTEINLNSTDKKPAKELRVVNRDDA